MPFEKISKEKKEKILELADEGMNRDAIAEEVGVSRATVSRYTGKYIRKGVGVRDLTQLLDRLSDLIEILSQREEIPKSQQYCPICGGILYPHFPEEGNFIWWLCPKCGYKGESQEPEWKQLQEYKIK